ncbi:MAG: chorismate synthase [Acidobacteriota bacterium]
MLRFVTAGESHGKCLVGILEGLPAGLQIDPAFINGELRRRQLGYGRGGRMRIEKDQVEITSGVRHGRTLGSPVSFFIENRDWKNWREAMSSEPAPDGANLRPVTRPRPGHVDLAGALKFSTHDVRDVLERASARETAARVAAGAICKLFLARFGARFGSHVLAIGRERVPAECESLPVAGILAIDPEAPVRCADPQAEKTMTALIDAARKAGDSLGGILEVVAAGLPAGLGTHAQWDRRLDGLIGQALMSIPACKAVEIGSGVSAAGAFGSEVHDEIFFDEGTHRFYRKTNRAGGIEGGISNGQEIRARLYMKPIPTLRKALRSVDLKSKEPMEASFERSDVCVVPAAAVIAEAMLALTLARAFLEKFGGDSMAEVEANFAGYGRLLDSY